ncbi:MAG: hypothetical protein ACRD1R_07915 [Acidobacteriota bacterium]
MGQELIAELNSFEVDFTSAGNMRVDVRSKNHHGDLVIATARALWSAVGRPSRKVEVGFLEKLLVTRVKRTGQAATIGTQTPMSTPADPQRPALTGFLVSNEARASPLAVRRQGL